MNQDNFVIFAGGPEELPEHSYYQRFFGFNIAMPKF